jgi:hypothetical protein
VVVTNDQEWSSSTRTSISPQLDLTVEQAESEVTGQWSAHLGRAKLQAAEHGWFSVTVRDTASGSVRGASQKMSDFPALIAEDTTAWPGQFQYTNESGTLRFTGERAGQKAQGAFRFTPDTNYARQIQAELKTNVAALDCFWLGLHHVTVAEAAGYARTGVRLSVAEVCRLKAHGVKPDYMAALRQVRDFSVDEIIRLRNHGIKPEYPAALKQAGYRLDTESLVRLRNHGVTAADAQGWKEAGYNLEVEPLIRLRNYGVRPEYGKAVRRVLPNAPPEDLVKLRQYGVSEQFLAEMRKAEGNFTLEELVRLRSHGVPPEYVAEWRKAGFGFKADELISLRRHGVPANYAAALNLPNRKPLSVDTILLLRQRGLSAEQVRALRE